MLGVLEIIGQKLIKYSWGDIIYLSSYELKSFIYDFIFKLISDSDKQLSQDYINGVIDTIRNILTAINEKDSEN